MALVSVIIPAYNNEEWVARCINSVRNQRYPNVEIIVVDDCSKDDTMAVLKTIACVTPKLHFMKNSKNMGVSYTRNRGLQNVNGDYVVFLDSDDYLYDDYISTAISEIKDADIWMSGMRVRSLSNHKDETIRFDKICEIEGKEIWQNVIANRYLCGVIGGKMYRRGSIGVVQFDESMAFQEDLNFNLQVLNRNTKVSLSRYVGYVYNKESTKQSDIVAIINNDMLLYNYAKNTGVSTDELDFVLNDIATNLYTAIYWASSFAKAEELVETVLENTSLTNFVDEFCQSSVNHKNLIYDIMEKNYTKDIKLIQTKRRLSSVKKMFSK